MQKKALQTYRNTITNQVSSGFGSKQILFAIESKYGIEFPNKYKDTPEYLNKLVKPFIKPSSRINTQDLLSTMFKYAFAYYMDHNAVKIYCTEDFGDKKCITADIEPLYKDIYFIIGEGYLIDFITTYEGTTCPARFSLFCVEDGFLTTDINIKYNQKNQTVMHNMELELKTFQIVTMNEQIIPHKHLSTCDIGQTDLDRLLQYSILNGMQLVVNYKNLMNQIPEEVPSIPKSLYYKDNRLSMKVEAPDKIEDIIYIDLADYIAEKQYPRKEWQGGHHASPIPHTRVAHYRRCKRGDYIQRDGVFHKVPKGTGNYCYVKASAVGYKGTLVDKTRVFVVRG